jgi:predicted cupin superfamily sugar epimerase
MRFRLVFLAAALFPLLTLPSGAAETLPVPSDSRARQLIEELHLQPLAGESGWFGGAETSALQVAQEGHTLRARSSIYYLLTRETPVNYLHGLASDDEHVLVEGGPVDYYLFLPDGTATRQTLGRDVEVGQRPRVVAPGGCQKALQLREGAGYALMVTVLAPEWTADRAQIGAGKEFIHRYANAAPWATPDFLRFLIGPNFR